MMNNRHVLSIGPSEEVTFDLADFEVTNEEVSATSSIENIWESGYQWDIEQVTNNGASHDLYKDARSDVVVAVIDTSFDFDHPDLKDNVDLEGSKTFVPGTTDLWDFNSHDTHVAGTIGADSRMKGGAPGVTLRSYRVFFVPPQIPGVITVSATGGASVRKIV